LQERIAYDTNTDVDRLYVVFYGGDRLLDILKGRVVRECFAGVVDFLACVVQTVVDFGKLVFQFFHILVYCCEGLLILAKLVRMSAIVTCLTLE